MAAAGGSQCGYCTPGFVMSLFAEQYRPGRVGPCDPLALAGNLCRCTGYRPIRDAALVARSGAGRAPCSIGWRSRAPRLDAVRAARLLAAGDARRVLRGARAPSRRGRHRRRVRPGRRIEPARHALAAPRQPRGHRRAARARATTPPRSGSARRCRSPTSSGGGATRPPVFAEWLALFASPPIRNRATLGGNLATASPIGDAAPLLLALDAVVHVAGRDGRRAMPLAVVLHRLPADRARARRDRHGDRDSEAVPAAPALLQGGQAPARRHQHGRGGDGDRSRHRRPRAAGAVRVRRRGRHAGARRRGRRRRHRSAVERGRRSSACSASLERTLTPISDHRGSAAYRLAGVAAAWSRSSVEESRA